MDMWSPEHVKQWGTTHVVMLGQGQGPTSYNSHNPIFFLFSLLLSSLFILYLKHRSCQAANVILVSIKSSEFFKIQAKVQAIAFLSLDQVWCYHKALSCYKTCLFIFFYFFYFFSPYTLSCSYNLCILQSKSVSP